MDSSQILTFFKDTKKYIYFRFIRNTAERKMIEIVAPCFFILKFVSPIKNKVRERPNPYYIIVVKSIMIPTLCSCNRVRTNTNNIAGTNKAKLKMLNQRVILKVFIS
jgi:hypothetical protein